jgi:hypothetical protein
MRKLWDHITYACNYIINALADLPDGRCGGPPVAQEPGPRARAMTAILFHSWWVTTAMHA